MNSLLRVSLSLLAVVTTSCGYREGVVRDRMATDTGCRPEAIEVATLPGGAYRASGCDTAQTYACALSAGGDFVCTREAAVTREPASPKQ